MALFIVKTCTVLAVASHALVPPEKYTEAIKVKS